MAIVMGMSAAVLHVHVVVRGYTCRHTCSLKPLNSVLSVNENKIK